MKSPLVLLLLMAFLVSASAGPTGAGNETCEDGEIAWIKVGPVTDSDSDGVPDWAEQPNGSTYNDSAFVAETGQQFAIVTKVSNNGCHNPGDCPAGCPQDVPIIGFVWRHGLGSHCNTLPCLYKWIGIEDHSADQVKVFWENPTEYTDTGLTSLEADMFQPFDLSSGDSALMVEYWTMPERACGAIALPTNNLGCVDDFGWSADRDYVNWASGGNQKIALDYPTNWFSVNNTTGQHVFYTTNFVVEDEIGNELPTGGDGEYDLVNSKTYTLNYEITNNGTANQETDFVENIYIDVAPGLCESLWNRISQTETLNQGQTRAFVDSYNPNADDPGNDCTASSNGVFSFTSTASGQGLVSSHYMHFDILGPSIDIQSVTPTGFYYEAATAEVDVLVQVENTGSDEFPAGSVLELVFTSFDPSFAQEYTETRVLATPLASGETRSETFSFAMSENSFGIHNVALEIYDGGTLIENGPSFFIHPHILTLSPDEVTTDIGTTVTASLNIKNDYSAPKHVDISSSRPGWISFDRIEETIPARSNTSTMPAGDLTVSVTPQCPASATQPIDIIASDELEDSVQLRVNVNNPEACNTGSLKISSFEFQPNPVSGPSVVSAVVAVENQSSGGLLSHVDLSLKDLVGQNMFSGSSGADVLIAAGATMVFSIPFSVDSSWEEGNYEGKASALRQGETTPDSEAIEYLSVGSPSRQPVPEMPFLLVFAVAFAVLAVALASGKKLA